METFQIQLDQKVTMWVRTKVCIEANSLEDAQRIAIDAYSNGVIDELHDCDFEHLYETQELMTPDENNHQATEELFLNEKLIKTN